VDRRTPRQGGLRASRPPGPTPIPKVKAFASDEKAQAFLEAELAKRRDEDYRTLAPAATVEGPFTLPATES